MSRSRHLSIAILLGVTSVLLGGCFSAIRMDHPPIETPSKIGGTVSVVVAPDLKYPPSPAEVQELADLLDATRLFDAVVLGPSPEADFEALAHETVGGWKCGNPLLIPIFTLGLISVDLPALGQPYHFELRRTDTTDPEQAKSAVLQRHDFGTVKIGFKALPIRATKAWRGESDDTPFLASVGALQHELQTHRDLLTSPDS